MLLSSSTFAAFILASLILAITPGPGVLYIVTRTLVQGRKAGLASIGGIALGNLGNTIAASIGLPAILATSATAFLVVKLVGAGYLIFLGVKTLRSRSAAAVGASFGHSRAGRLFRDGFIVALLNPKTALFFAALLPQFMTPAAPPLSQSLMLGCVFVGIAICTDTVYVLLAAALAPTIAKRSVLGPYGRVVSAATFIGLGVYAVFAHPRSVR